MGQFFRSLDNAPLKFRIQHFQLPRQPVKLSENPGARAAQSIGFRPGKRRFLWRSLALRRR
jgi:hypothetical protein